MNKEKNISMSVIKRLPRYYRYLIDLKSKNVMRISSRQLSGKMNITASQIRQDLNHFGEFGQQGYGYNVALLHDEIRKILGVKKMHKTILIGAGNLGSAIAKHMNFTLWGFNLIGIFDKDAKKIGKIVAGIEVAADENLEKYCAEKSPKVAILCIPKDGMLEITKRLEECGIKGIWNFSPVDLPLEGNIVVQNVHLGDSLGTLCYGLKNL